MPLSDVQIRHAKPREKPYKLADERGLYLEVSSAGGKWWRFKYRFGGKEKRLSLGVYPEVGLAQARENLWDVRERIRQGVDPSEARKAKKAANAERGANSFEVVAREWLLIATRKNGSPTRPTKNAFSPAHAQTVINRLERYVFPRLGQKPASEIDPPAVLQVLRQVESHLSAHLAHKIKQHIGQVMRLAVATGRATHDPTPILRGALAQPVVTHRPAITDPKLVGELLRAIDSYQVLPDRRGKAGVNSTAADSGRIHPPVKRMSGGCA
jgi:hypothetical protein